MKPTSSYCRGNEIRIPKGNIHYEVELAVIIGKEAKNVSTSNAMSHVKGYAVAIDVTDREMQQEAKKQGLPWCLSKGQDNFTPITDSFFELPDQIWLKQNSILKQQGFVKDMLFDVKYIISDASRYMKLENGDVILTGTPEGVGKMNHDDFIEVGAEINDKNVIYGKWTVKVF